MYPQFQKAVGTLPLLTEFHSFLNALYLKLSEVVIFLLFAAVFMSRSRCLWILASKIKIFGTGLDMIL